MKTEAQLKSEVFEVLSKYQNLSDFFRTAIEQRMRIARWLENPLVRVILSEKSETLEIIDSRVRSAREICEEGYSELRGAIISQVRGFDEQANDILVELRAIEWISENGYRDIQRIPKSHHKTPDFRATKDAPALFEVKNLRAPNRVSDRLIQCLSAESFKEMFPYQKHMFNVRCVTQSDSEVVTDKDRYVIGIFVRAVENAMLEGSKRVEQEYETDSLGKRIDRKLICDIYPSDHFQCIWTMERFSPTMDLASKETELLKYVAPKLLFTAISAANQLTALSDDSVRERVILFNWEMIPEFTMGNAATRFYELADRFEAVLQIVDKTLSVRFINH